MFKHLHELIIFEDFCCIFLSCVFQVSRFVFAVHSYLCETVCLCAAFAAAKHAPASAWIQPNPTISAYYVGCLEQYLFALDING